MSWFDNLGDDTTEPAVIDWDSMDYGSPAGAGSEYICETGMTWCDDYSDSSSPSDSGSTSEQ